ncbi:uncharacterized protein HMPREF1541_04309 [Cyphellophora europaea CBS 101466]|uniref:Catalase n=1 Tax=Cyphellophora europaea (strain CBS 101466) TaxID=1220924 RepID=W2RWH1_CYPE1|nr:uncharacterized protein HMPREF1541_04309 [Cyphellophora europaea CBS 101466]ETN40034.1 hypothetical protein HMPREF1541_04309 [Cyphellophora europaea CBS 101466]
MGVGSAAFSSPSISHEKRQESQTAPESTEEFLTQFINDDNDTFMTSDTGTPIEDQGTLRAGERGPSLLEDFIFRQKIMRFDHERVAERAVHARGAAAHGYFESYGDWSNLTAASFLADAGKRTPVFLRFSTVAGSRGSADTVRDVHGYAARFYTDEGNFDIVGNNIPVFFIQDAIRFPDLIHAVKPEPDREIPQAATGHDTAWDFFSQQPSTLHTLFWAMSGWGIPRSYRHTDGFGVHSFRMVTDEGESKLVKFHFKSLQGRASLVWEEAQILSAINPDYHRQDLWTSIENGHFPEWEFGVQVVDESDALAYGFDMLDPTKILPEDLVPVQPLGRLVLNRNPTNYFAETEQVMYQVGHLVRGIDFSEDPLLQGRPFSYLDTQLSRHNGPNFEQLPINRPHSPVSNNHRDGPAQMEIHTNKHAYTPSSLNASPRQATRNQGRGFFSSPARTLSDQLTRNLSTTFEDVWSQPRLFYNSLAPAERQMVINAIRFETSQLSAPIQANVLVQLNRISHDIVTLVAQALDVEAPPPDDTFYHTNTTINVRTFDTATPLWRLDSLTVAILASATDEAGLAAARNLAEQLAAQLNVTVDIVAERLLEGVDGTYASANAAAYDAVVLSAGAARALVMKGGNGTAASSLFPAHRPRRIVADAYRYGKPVAIFGDFQGGEEEVGAVWDAVDVQAGPGVLVAGSSEVGELVGELEGALRTWRFVGRFAVDDGVGDA